MALPEVKVQDWTDEEEVEVHRWTREEYEQMAEAGVFAPDKRVELVDGVIYDMSPQTIPHATGIAKANRTLGEAFGRGYHLRPQLPLDLGTYSMPEPDFAVIPGDPDDYVATGHHPSDAVLVVEVTETSQYHDRKRKAKLYAETGLREYWIVNLRRDAIEVFQDPKGGEYRKKLVLQRGQQISPLARPEVSIAVDDLLPRK